MTSARRDFKGASVPAKLTALVNSTAVTLAIDDATGWPTGANGEFLVVIDRDLATQEKVLCLSRSGLNITVANAGKRGADNTTAQGHASGAPIEHCGGALDLDDANDHIYTTTRDDHTQYIPVATGAGDGLGITGRVLHVNVDSSGIETSSDAIRLKDGGTTLAKLANLANATVIGRNTAGTGVPEAVTMAQLKTLLALVASNVSDFTEAVQDVVGALALGGNGLTATYDDAGNADSIAVNVDGSSIEINADTLRVKALGIAASMLAANSVTTSKIDPAVLTAAGDGFINTATVVCSSPVTITAVGSPAAAPQTVTDVLTMACTRAGQQFLCWGTTDVFYTGNTGGLSEAISSLSVDNATVLTTPYIIGKSSVPGVTMRVTLGQFWLVSGLSVASHTFRLKAYKQDGDDDFIVNATHTQLAVVRLG